MNRRPSVLRSGLSRAVHPIGERRATKLAEFSEQSKALPFYHQLPTEHIDNLRWRVYARQRAMVDLDFRDDLMAMCAQDIAFMAETFAMVFEPRPVPRDIPMKLWTDQVDVLAWLLECFGERDMGVEKSRGIGMSWIIAIFVYWVARFHPNAKIALVSKDETSLDGPDSNSLLGKIVYLHENMPAWMRFDEFGRETLKRNTTDHSLSFRDTGSTVQGFVPTNEKLRSFRFTCVVYDEFAFLPRNVQAQLNSSVHTAPNRVFISTWNGCNNAFHEIMRGKPSTMLACEMYWWNNTERWQGAYTSEAGVLKIIDTSYVYPKDYPFVLDGLLRSPWVDFELRRPGSSPQSAMEELYGIAAGDGRKLFRRSVVEIAKTTVQLPMKRGDIRLVRDVPTFVPSRDGPVKIFADIGGGMGGPFTAACDLSFGRGSSYSTLEIISLKTGEQVMDVAVDDMNPIEFAQYVVGILQWLNGDEGDAYTYLTFENNGDQGTQFSGEVVRLGYGNLMKRAYASRGPKRDAQDRSGYYGMRNRDGGAAIMAEMERAVLVGELTVRSEECRIEMEEFELDDEGRPTFPQSADGHGDRVQGLAMAWVQGRERMEEQEDTSPEAQQRNARAEIENLQDGPRVRWSSAWSIRHNRL